MCGINGYLNPAGVTSDHIEAMNHALRHRGPDDEGVFISTDRTVGLGHKRLSIIDLSSGHQPMTNEDGTLTIVFNGEIYNFKEIRDNLADTHSFSTQSDTEVILHLYEEKGVDCLRYLRGMFSFAIYDSRNEKLFAARDHFGQKPFFYHHDGNGRFAFSSEIKSLLELDSSLAEMDCQALYEYLTLRIITPPRSMFKRIRKLPPSHYLIYEKNRLTIERYWQLNYVPKQNLSFDDAADGLIEEMEESVRYHLVSDVPVGAFLSGGMDSSLIVTMMNRVGSSGFKTFSGNVPYEGYSEGPFAKLVADKYQTDHHELNIHPSLIRLMPDLLRHLDEPSDPLSVCMYCISELARKQVKVVMGGDGGDELFGGYDRYYGNQYVRFYAMLPEKLRENIISRLLDRMPEGFWYRSLSHQLRWIHQMSFYKGGERYAKSLSYFYFSDRHKKELYTENFWKKVGMFDPELNLSAYFDSASADDLLDKMLSVDSMTRMVDHPNMILDRMTMAHGLEARSPFLDHKLAEYCATLPPEFKIKGTRTRRIQVELAKRFLPPELVRKPKQGFSSPLTYMLQDEFRILFRLFLNDSSLVRDGFLNAAPIQRLLQDHLEQKVDNGNRLWLLCNAEIWYRMFIEGQGYENLKQYLHEGAAQ
jgi:asparagine synthase (glutamine-hydrolysing)